MKERLKAATPRRRKNFDVAKLLGKQRTLRKTE